MCQKKCSFCHHEGIDKDENLEVNEELFNTLKKLRARYGILQVHLTGGEPTLFKNLDVLVKHLKNRDYKIAITTNGMFQFNKLKHIVKNFDYVNFSIHMFDESKINTESQMNVYSKVINFKEVIDNIEKIRKIVPIKINCVVGRNIRDLNDVYNFTRRRQIALRLVTDWCSEEQALTNIFHFVSVRRFKLKKIIFYQPSSNYQLIFCDKNAEVGIKLLHRYQPNFLCSHCSMKEKCKEGFAFIRLEGNPLRIRLCIHHKFRRPYVFSCNQFWVIYGVRLDILDILERN